MANIKEVSLAELDVDFDLKVNTDYRFSNKYACESAANERLERACRNIYKYFDRYHASNLARQLAKKYEQQVLGKNENDLRIEYERILDRYVDTFVVASKYIDKVKFKYERSTDQYAYDALDVLIEMRLFLTKRAREYCEEIYSYTKLNYGL